MEKDRLQAFSEGVIAILITIMVLELKIPSGSGGSDLRPLVPVFLTYVLSFVNLGIYWNNQHHLLSATQRINGAVLWANLRLLSWLSLFPFFTGWMGENHFDTLPTAALGRDVKGKISPAIYVVAIPLAFAKRWVAVALYVVVALMWFVPDRRIESRIRG